VLGDLFKIDSDRIVFATTSNAVYFYSLASRQTKQTVYKEDIVDI